MPITTKEKRDGDEKKFSRKKPFLKGTANPEQHSPTVTTLFQSDRTWISRVPSEDSSGTAILKSLKVERPGQADLAQFFHEYEILYQLKGIPGVLDVLKKTTFEGLASFILEDTLAVSLKDLLNQRPVDSKILELSEFFALAETTLQTLGAIHSRGIIHKDLNPANILVRPNLSNSWIIDFGIALKTRREVQTQKPLKKLEGTLDYLPPEQSGRMNRSLDYRADYYSLGITFFEILTGRLPYQSSDLMELLHCHMVDPLPDLCVLRAEIPQALSQIIYKLAAKDPNDRYQSTLGILSDLGRAKALWLKKDLNTRFTLGTDDFPEQLILPEKIYGREKEGSALLEIFEKHQKERTPSHALQDSLTLIAGPSGVGKSALIHQLLMPIASKGGYLVEGKIDQFQRSILSGFKQAFLNYFELLAGESVPLVEKLRSQLTARLGADLAAIPDSIPELTPYLGEYPKPALLKADETRLRLLKAFTELLRTMAAQKPMVLFIDDLQWADSMTLSLLESLTQAGIENLILLGSYRSDEVQEGHPLLSLVRRIGQSVRTLPLEPLREEFVSDLLKDTLGNSSQLAETTRLMLRKTAGNPFFVHQLLKQLYSDSILTRDPSLKVWKVDLPQFEQMQVSQNVAEFVKAKMQLFEPTTKTFLTTAATCGAHFHLEIIARALNQKPEELLAPIETAIQNEIIRPRKGNFQHWLSSKIYDPGQNYEFQFLHDRLQQASYELKTEKEQQNTHLLLALVLRQSQASPIAIAEHFLKSSLEIQTEEVRRRAAEVFIDAAVQAKDSAAFSRALTYIERANELVPERTWESDPPFMRRLYQELSKIAFSASATEACAAYSKILLDRSRDDLERAESYLLQADQMFANSKFQAAVELALKALNSLGIPQKFKVSPPEIIWSIIKTMKAVQKIRKKGKGLLPVLEMPEIRDRRLLLLLEIPLMLAPACFFIGNVGLALMVILRTARITMEYGLSEYAMNGIAGLALLAGTMKNYPLSHDVSELVLRLFTHPISTNKRANTNAHFWICCFGIWVDFRADDRLAHYSSAFDGACELRGFVPSFAVGNILEDVYERIRLSEFSGFNDLKERLRNLNFGTADAIFSGPALYVETLNSKEPSNLTKKLAKLQVEINHEISIGHVNKAALDDIVAVSLEYLFYPPQETDFKNRAAFKYRESIKGMFAEMRLGFFSALSILKFYRSENKSLNLRDSIRLKSERKFLSRLNLRNPRNFSYYHFLVEAEYAAYEAEPSQKVVPLYRRSIQFAKEDGNRFIEALAFEKLGEYYLSLGALEAAWSSLSSSRQLYIDHEAWARVAFLDEKYPKLSLWDLGVTSTRFATPSYTEEVLEAARSLSEAVSLRTLSNKLMKIASELSGAERVALLFPHQTEQNTPHRSYLQFDQNSQTFVDPVKNRSFVPATIVDRVSLSREPFLTPDATCDERLRGDPSWGKTEIRSMLCLPALNQGRLIALLYLENSKTVGAFTEDRLKALDILASQAAVSIENARLVENLEEKVRLRTTQLAQKTRDLTAMLRNLQQGVFSLQRDLTIHPEYSAYLEVIFGKSQLSGRNGLEILFENAAISSNTFSEIDSALNSSLEGTAIGFDVNRHLLPREVTRKVQTKAGEFFDQFLELDWKAILDSQGSVEKILVTLRDVTELKKLQAEALEQKEELALIQELLECGFDSFRQSYAEAERAFSENRELLNSELNQNSINRETLDRLFRNFHTVKGSMRMRGLKQAVEAVHEAEQFLDGVRKGEKRPDRQKFNLDLDRAANALDRYFRVAKDKLGTFGAKLNPSHSPNQALGPLGFQSLQEILAAEIRALPKLALSLGKKPPKVLTASELPGDRPGQYLFAGERAPVLRAIFTHCLNNSLDHGLETPRDRMDKGKPEAGTIQIKISRSASRPERIRLSIQDDGRGLNLKALQEKGVQLGICKEGATDSEISQVAFASGISTAAAVTEVSGRGVGLDAVRAMAEGAGCLVRLEFTGERASSQFRPFLLAFELPSAWVSEDAAVNAGKGLKNAA